MYGNMLDNLLSRYGQIQQLKDMSAQREAANEAHGAYMDTEAARRQAANAEAMAYEQQAQGEYQARMAKEELDGKRRVLLDALDSPGQFDQLRASLPLDEQALLPEVYNKPELERRLRMTQDIETRLEAALAPPPEEPEGNWHMNPDGTAMIDRKTGTMQPVDEQFMPAPEEQAPRPPVNMGGGTMWTQDEGFGPIPQFGGGHAAGTGGDDAPKVDLPAEVMRYVNTEFPKFAAGREITPALIMEFMAAAGHGLQQVAPFDTKDLQQFLLRYATKTPLFGGGSMLGAPATAPATPAAQPAPAPAPAAAQPSLPPELQGLNPAELEATAQQAGYQSVEAMLADLAAGG